MYTNTYAYRVRSYIYYTQMHHGKTFMLGQYSALRRDVFRTATLYSFQVYSPLKSAPQTKGHIVHP